jgi:hypothetical protein
MGQKVTKYALTSGANVAILATAYARKVKIQEDQSGPPAGIVLTWPDGSVAAYTVAEQPVILENAGGGAGPLLGVPASQPAVQSYVGCGINATQYCQAKSVGATSVLQVTEEN